VVTPEDDVNDPKTAARDETAEQRAGVLRRSGRSVRHTTHRTFRSLLSLIHI